MIIEETNAKEEASDDINLDELKESLINHICVENKAFFKSLQKNEKDLEFDERREIVENVFNNSSHTRFLSRFGMNLKKEHLKYFEIANRRKDDTQLEEEKEILREQLKTLSYNLDHQKVLVKNRRYAAMVKLIAEKQYFSESEMKERDPLLYEQLIGQFMTSAEKRARRRPDAKSNTLVDVLFEGYDHEHICEKEKKQRELETSIYGHEDEESQSAKDSEIDSENEDIDRRQWGNFDIDSQEEKREECPLASSSRPKKRNMQMITAGERDVLREEFLGIMYNNFLSGKDTEFFDYSQVDSNETYDETLENAQDCEDKYFDEEEAHESSTREQQSDMKMGDDTSEDELDVYMRHIEDHVKKQREETFQEEFDDN